jgi:hypothetical protein
MKKVKIRNIGDGKNAQVSVSKDDLEYAGLRIGDLVWRIAERNGVMSFGLEVRLPMNLATISCYSPQYIVVATDENYLSCFDAKYFTEK